MSKVIQRPDIPPGKDVVAGERQLVADACQRQLTQFVDDAQRTGRQHFKARPQVLRLHTHVPEQTGAPAQLLGWVSGEGRDMRTGVSASSPAETRRSACNCRPHNSAQRHQGPQAAPVKRALYVVARDVARPVDWRRASHPADRDQRLPRSARASRAENRDHGCAGSPAGRERNLQLVDHLPASVARTRLAFYLSALPQWS